MTIFMAMLLLHSSGSYPPLLRVSYNMILIVLDEGDNQNANEGSA
jgi:hypothetical protein